MKVRLLPALRVYSGPKPPCSIPGQQELQGPAWSSTTQPSLKTLPCAQLQHPLSVQAFKPAQPRGNLCFLCSSKDSAWKSRREQGNPGNKRGPAAQHQQSPECWNLEEQQGWDTRRERRWEIWERLQGRCSAPRGWSSSRARLHPGALLLQRCPRHKDTATKGTLGFRHAESGHLPPSRCAPNPSLLPAAPGGQ